HGILNDFSDASGQYQNVTILRSIGVHPRQKTLSRSKIRHCFCPLDRVAIRSHTAALRIDLYTAVFTASVNGDNNALAPKSFRCFLHEFRGIDGGGVQGYFIRAAAQYFLDVVDIAQAAS